jgi:hypothetical protein
VRGLMCRAAVVAGAGVVLLGPAAGWPAPPGARATLTSVSCAPAGTCSAGGLYTDSSGRQQAFVVNKACHPDRWHLPPRSRPRPCQAAVR